MSTISGMVRVAVALGVPNAILNRGSSLRGTKLLARAAIKARLGAGRPFQMVNVGACDGNGIDHVDAFLVDCEGADWTVFKQLDLERYRPGLIKVEIGALPAVEIGNVLIKLKTAGYDVGLYAEDVWAFA